MEDEFLWESTTVDEKEQEQWDVLFEQMIENRVREFVDCKDELPENVPDLGLWDFFHRNTFTKDGAPCQPVIILDQFEETLPIWTWCL